MKLKDKTAVVIGAGGGIGSVVVEKLKSGGANVIGVGKDESKLKKLDIKYYICDISDPKRVKELITDLTKDLKSIDVLINAAGLAKYGNIRDLNADDVNVAFEVNVKAPLMIIKGLLSILEKADEPVVINIGSGAGKIPMRGRSLYCSTKFALRGLSMSLSEEYKDQNPKFIHVALGSTLTEFGPMTLKEKEKAAKSGKAYFPVDYVADQIVEIIKDQKKQEPEVQLYPSEHGFGEWKKP